MELIRSLPLPPPGRARAAALAAPLVAFAATAAILGSRSIQAGSLTRATPLLLVIALVFGALAIRYSGAGSAVLVLFVYLDLSEALVRYHFPSLLQLLVAGLAFAAWLKRDTATMRELLTQPLTLAIALWMLVAFVSTAWASDRALADFRYGDLLKAFALYLLATALMCNRTRLLQGVAALLASAGFLGVLTTMQFATGQTERAFGGLGRYEKAQIYGEVFQPRAAGPVGDPNFYAEILLVVLPLAILLGFSVRPLWKRLAILAVALFVFLAIALTYSRGAMVALAAMGLLMLKPLHVRWRDTALGAIALVLLLFMLPSGVTRRFDTLQQIVRPSQAAVRPDSSIAERRVYMAVATEMFARHPIEGVGIGNYPARYDEYIGYVSSSAKIYPRANPQRYPHNLYLEIAAETGIIGLFAFAVMLLALWHALRDSDRALASAGDRTMATLTIALGIAIAGFLVASLFLHLAVPRYLFLLLAFAASVQRVALQGRSTA